MKVFLVLLVASVCNGQNYTFPDGFTFGVATASYQVEGAWDANGKGENIWDHLTHNFPEYIADRSNGDIACDTYHKTVEDVQLLKNLGVDFYRISLSWSRILPTGHVNRINEDGIRYYNELFDELLANGITPLVTIFHWDLPQPLQEIGGWPNELISEFYADYADLVFASFGDRVKNWLTFNEPNPICLHGYAIGEMAPAYTQDGIGGYLCQRTLLLSHAKAYHIYNEKYRESQQGRVGITFDSTWYEPASDSEEDQEAAENVMQLTFGWHAHPIFSEEGDYPAVMRARIDAFSAEEGFPRSRLPYLTADEVEFIRGTADFFGLNHYSTNLCTPLEEGSVARPSNTYDAGGNCYQPDDWESAESPWLRTVPWGFRKILNWIKEEYNNPEVIITENGFSDNDSVGLNDCRRIFYYNSYLEALLAAIYEDGCNISGYTAWSFLDNFEWMQGYTQRFGLHFVDFEDENRSRTPKMSSYVFRNIIKTRQIDWDYTPDGFEACEW